jgi:uncharacterized protein (TIGR01777 family)
MAKILISGGNGMLGKAITEELLHKGHTVNWLCRKPVIENKVKVFLWDPASRSIDLKAFEGVEHLINLSGSNIAGKPWNKKNKAEIYRSRVDSTAFLLETMQQNNILLKTTCGASATGYYGNEHKEAFCDENTAAGSDFLAQVCRNWEKTYETFAPKQTRLVILRIGIVLSEQGGIYAKLRPLVKTGLAAVIGSGKNYISWIHIRDLVRLFVFAIENPAVHGIYNATASEPKNLEDFTRMMATSLNRNVFLPRLPSFLLRLVLGERASLLVKGCRVKNDKIRALGFNFEFPQLSSALSDLAHQKIQRRS